MKRLSDTKGASLAVCPKIDSYMGTDYSINAGNDRATTIIKLFIPS